MVTLGGRLNGKIRTQLPDAYRTILWFLQVTRVGSPRTLSIFP